MIATLRQPRCTRDANAARVDTRYSAAARRTRRAQHAPLRAVWREISFTEARMSVAATIRHAATALTACRHAACRSCRRRYGAALQMQQARKRAQRMVACAKTQDACVDAAAPMPRHP